MKRAWILGVALLLSATTACASRPVRSVAALSTSSAAATMTESMPAAKSPPPGKIVPSPGAFDFNPFAPPDAPYTIKYNNDLTSDPVDPNTPVTVTANAAVRAVIDADGKDDYRRPGSPSATLREVSVGYKGQDDSFAPHLGWVLTWTGGHTFVGGPASLSPSARSEMQSSYTCNVVVVVNATTAKVEGDGEFYFCSQPDAPSAAVSP